MKQDWHPDELVLHFTLAPDEHSLLEGKPLSAQLGFLVLLKTFQLEGRFPRRGEVCPTRVLKVLSQQIGCAEDGFLELDWSERTLSRYQAQIRQFMGFREFALEDAEPLTAWLTARVVSPDPMQEAFKQQAYSRLRDLKLEPPTPERLVRLLRSAVVRWEHGIFETLTQKLSPSCRHALDALIQADEDDSVSGEQQMLFVVRSDLAVLKDTAGAVKVSTVLEELDKLKMLRALELPPNLFEQVSPKIVAHYRRRAAGEPPRELRRHPPEVRYTLLAALCWQRQVEIIDGLTDLLIHIAHHIGTRAEDKVEHELLKALKKVAGKTKLLYKLAKAARAKPEGTVQDVIYPAVAATVLDSLIQESELEGSYERQVRLVTRNSYGHHYRRIIPLLLEALNFRCNNERHRPVMKALELLEKHRDRSSPTFPSQEEVPLDGVVKDDWHDLVLDDKDNGRVNRIAYEMCVLSTLREKVRCKEVWVEGAGRFRNPDDDLPQNFEQHREAYYLALKQPRESASFVDILRHSMEQALEALDGSLPSNPKVKVLVSKKGKGRIAISPLEVQPEPPHILKLTAALVQRWPMTNLLDILKETELRVGFTEVFRSAGNREVLEKGVLQRRLLLCLHGLGTNAGLKRMCSGGGEDGIGHLMEDAVKMAFDAVCLTLLPLPQGVAVFVEQVRDAYLAGLREGGWRGEEQLLRRAFSAAAARRYGPHLLWLAEDLQTQTALCRDFLNVDYQQMQPRWTEAVSNALALGREALAGI